MELREDFQQVSQEISKLTKLSEILKDFDQNKWPHLKNMEDFEKIYYMTINEDIKRSFERLYEDGRLIAGQLWQTVYSINHKDQYPDLYSFVRHLETGWVNEENIRFLAVELNKFKKNYNWLVENYGYGVRAVKGMIELYEKQIEIIQEMKSILEDIKNSPEFVKIEKQEGGIFSFLKKLWKK
ncbi:hypothetical protein [Persephonella sp.]